MTSSSEKEREEQEEEGQRRRRRRRWRREDDEGCVLRILRVFESTEPILIGLLYFGSSRDEVMLL